MVMRTEKWLVLCIALLLIQLVACERGKMEENTPVPVSARMGADTLGVDTLRTDTIRIDSSGIDSLITDSEQVKVPVNNQVFPSEKPILEHDVLSVTPIAYGDTAENLVGFKFVTAESYPCTQNELLAEVLTGQNSYLIKFAKTLTGIQCYTSTQSQGSGFTSIYQIPGNFEGSLDIQFNGKVYKGTMKRKGKYGYEFHWPHDSGVVFTKKQL